MIELISEEKLKSTEYLRIRCEFYDIWNKLFIAKNRIDEAILRKYGRLWPLLKAISLSRLHNLWFIPSIEGTPVNSELILHSNQLWMIRACQ